MVDEVKKGIKGIRVPSKRISDTIGDDLFRKKVLQAGFDGISDFNQAFIAAGGDLGDAANKTKFLNAYLPKEEAPYRNIITDRIKSKYEMLSGGARPGTVGAPENKVYWQAATAAEKEAIDKFPKDTKLDKQKRLTYVKKYLKNAGVPAKWLLNNLPKMGLYTAGAATPISALASAMLYAGTSKPAMGALPEEPLKNQILRGIDFGAPSANAQLLEQMSQDATMKAGGGMMNMNEIIRPIGMQNGGDPVQERKNEMLKAMTRKEGERRADMNTGNPEMERMSTYGEMPESDIIQLAGQIAMQQGDTSEENIRKIIMQLSQTLPSLQQDMSDERRSPISSGVASLMNMLGLNKKTKLDRDVSAARTK